MLNRAETINYLRQNAELVTRGILIGEAFHDHPETQVLLPLIDTVPEPSKVGIYLGYMSSKKAVEIVGAHDV